MKEQPQKLLSEYHIDIEDRLIFIDDNWYAFARANQAPYLADAQILGKSLWDFITGNEVQNLYNLMLKKVRLSGEPVQVLYRCDAPHLRRFLQLKMMSADQGAVRFHNWLVREEVRPPVQLFDVLPKRSQEFVTVCSWCKQIKLAEAEWVEVEEAVERLGLFESAELPQLSHGICPGCLQRWLSDLR
jgi:hypothetical protein